MLVHDDKKAAVKLTPQRTGHFVGESLVLYAYSTNQLLGHPWGYYNSHVE